MVAQRTRPLWCGGWLWRQQELSQRDEEWRKLIPAPLKKNTEDDIEQMFKDKYYYVPEGGVWNGADKWDLKEGVHCLWRGVGQGKKGGQSTKEEYFHGEIHGWNDKDNVVIT